VRETKQVSTPRIAVPFLCGAALLLAIFTPGICRSAGAQFPAEAQRNQAAEPSLDPTQSAEAELQTGSALTRQGKFQEAIPHLVAARGRVTEEYAAGFNLALCYVGTKQFKKAIELLTQIRQEGNDTAMAENLLAQAYIGNSQGKEGLDALKKSVAQEPDNEKLYLYVTDACLDQRNYTLGLSVADMGLQHVPRSAKLHFERGMLLIKLDRLDLAKGEMDMASKLAPGSDIAYMAMANRNLQEGNIPEALRVAQEAVAKGSTNYLVLQVLGESLLREGAVPGQPQFAQAQSAMEKSVAERPNYAPSQVTLGKIYLMEGRVDDAIAHLETARQLDPRNTSAYSHLAAAYRRKGDAQQSQAMLAILSRLNQDEVERIRTSPGETKGGYVGSAVEQNTAKTPHP